MVKYMGAIRMKMVAFHKDVCFLQFRANGTDLCLLKAIVSEATHRWTRRGRTSISSSTNTPTLPANCSYKHKPPMENLNVPTDVINNTLPVLR